MKEFQGNKTLLPLVSGESPFTGGHPVLLQILNSLPPGPKAVVVNYKKESIIEATHRLGITYCEQPELNGTGGALLAARSFIEIQDCDQLIITMGDVPFVNRETYMLLIKALKHNKLVILGFRPQSRKQYGALETEDNQVQRIIEWKYWRTYSQERQKALEIYNSGIYAVMKKDLLKYLPVLASRPHKVVKETNRREVKREEYFITDLVEYMRNDGLPVGYQIVEDEKEVMGIDDLSALLKAQETFLITSKNSSQSF